MDSHPYQFDDVAVSTGDDGRIGGFSRNSSSMGFVTRKSLPIETEFIMTGGYRKDNLDWNIAGDTTGNHPNILSELTWDDVESGTER